MGRTRLCLSVAASVTLAVFTPMLFSAPAASASTTTSTVTPLTATTSSQADSLCGAPSNPDGYTYCQTGGSRITNPAQNTCSFFPCIHNFSKEGGYMVECVDGKVSMTGGLPSACRYHHGVLLTVYQLPSASPPTTAAAGPATASSGGISPDSTASGAPSPATDQPSLAFTGVGTTSAVIAAVGGVLAIVGTGTRRRLVRSVKR